MLDWDDPDSIRTRSMSRRSREQSRQAGKISAARKIGRRSKACRWRRRRRHLRLHHRRRRQRRLRARQPADRVGPPRVLLLEAGGHDRTSLDPHPARLRQAVRRPQRQLALRDRAGARARQPRDHPAARQGAGRVELDQRPALYARPAARTSTTGASSAMPAGASTTCCPISARAEDQERGADDLHGVGGPLCGVRRLRAASAVRGLHRGGAAGGLSAQRRFQRRRRQEGAGYFQLTARNGRRCSTARRLSAAGAARGPISRSCPTRWRRASCSTAAARSASNTGSGGATASRARRGEVILAGGAFNSPQLLQLSGLGPAALLRSLGIDGGRRHAGRRRRSAGPSSRSACSTAAPSRSR